MNNREYDVIILGSGPAGLQAAIHAARAKVSVLVLGRNENSSIHNAHIVNFCCSEYSSGTELLDQGKKQAIESGVDFIEEDSIETTKHGNDFLIKTESGTLYSSKALIYTLGITRNKLGVKGEKELEGKGVSYCVDCDAGFYKDKPVAITGNGSAAVSGAITLSSYTDTVHLISDEISVSDNLQRQLEESSVKIHSNKSVDEIVGADKVEKVILNDGNELEVNGIFVERGAKGAIELAGFMGIEMDDQFKHIAVNKETETNIPGVYAAGDITGTPYQVAKAIGEGCIAGLNAAHYAKKIKANHSKEAKAS